MHHPLTVNSTKMVKARAIADLFFTNYNGNIMGVAWVYLENLHSRVVSLSNWDLEKRLEYNELELSK